MDLQENGHQQSDWRHRSVAIARYIFDHISKTRKQIEVKHRDIDK